MNQALAEFSSEEQQQLDRLVDGELSEAERRTLLASFDARPDAWRRCALAFLEAQSWRGEMRVLGHSSVENRAAASPLTRLSPARGEGNTVRPVSRWWRESYGGLPLAMAACFLLALSVAWVLRPPALGPDVVDDASVSGSVIGALAAVDPSAIPKADRDLGPAGEHWDTVTLVMDDGRQGRQEIQYPFSDGEAADDNWLDRPEPVVPRELRAALERLGHHVNERRQLVPVDLEDGRRMIVPVDDVEFTPVSSQAFQ